MADAGATSLLRQCQAAHADLMKLAYSEEALLAKLEAEIHRLTTKQTASKETSSEGGTEPSEEEKTQKLPKFLGLSRTGTKAFPGGESSSPSKIMESDTADTHHHHYSINGIDGKERSMVRNTLASLLKSNFASESSRGVCTRCSRWFVAMLVAWENCLALEEPPRHGCLHRFVNSTAFGMVSGTVILLNAIFIFYTTDLEMQNIDSPFELDTNVQIAELLLASFYVVELMLKLMVHRLFFFWNSEMNWNCFDTVLVVFSIFENLLNFLAFNSSTDSTSGVNLAFLRLVRLCRIVKILRIFRTLKFFSELRLMLDCVLGSLMNVMWCVIMLVFVMYVFALLLQQGIVQHLADVQLRNQGQVVEEVRDLCQEDNMSKLMRYFGSVGNTVVTLFQASTSGVDWNDPYQALTDTGMVLPMAFLGYVAFVFISVWNIVTSIFVEKALKLAMPDADMAIVEQQLQDAQDTKMLTKLFKSKSRSVGGNERLGLDEFRKLVETYEFRSYLQSRSIDIKNAETFFRMLVELQGETSIDATTFANACVRMKGAATSIDLQTVMFTTHLMNREQRKSFESLSSSLAHIEGLIGSQNAPVKNSDVQSPPVIALNDSTRLQL